MAADLPFFVDVPPQQEEMGAGPGAQPGQPHVQPRQGYRSGGHRADKSGMCNCRVLNIDLAGLHWKWWGEPPERRAERQQIDASFSNGGQPAQAYNGGQPAGGHAAMGLSTPSSSASNRGEQRIKQPPPVPALRGNVF